MYCEHIEELLDRALAARAAFFDPQHLSALRLFNGFIEGCPYLSIDLFAGSAVIYNYAETPEAGLPFVEEAMGFLRNNLPWLRAGILKNRASQRLEERRGVSYFGDQPDRKIRENGIWYAIDLTMSQDASLYLDTRNLRHWLMEHASGKTVLNSFAYTGSLGVAALAGGANRVVQLDRNCKYLNLGKTSYTLNGFPINKVDFICTDFFRQASNFRRKQITFDCVLIDPPLFSASASGMVDLMHDSAHLINKVRPLVNDGGELVVVNNALFVSGQEFMHTLEGLCKDGYMQISELIPAPEDFTGFTGTRLEDPVTDPAPFKYSTKIAVLQVKRKAAD